MPFQSEKQRRYLWANEPEIARDWTDTYGSGIAKALGGRIGFFKGAQADTASGKSMSPGTSAGHTPGAGHRDSGGWSPGVGGTQHIPTPKPDRKPAKDVWNIKRKYGVGPWMGGPLSPYGQYGMPDLNKLYRLKMNEYLKEQEEETPIYSEFDRIPMDIYKGLGIGRNYIPTGEDLLNIGPYQRHSGSSTLPEYKEIGLTDMQKELLDQRKSMLGALGSQGILDTITSEDDPNDPATLQDVKGYYDLALGGLASLWPR